MLTPSPPTIFFSYVAVQTKSIDSNEQVVRYYTPISRVDCLGHFDLLIKIDSGEGGGPMSKAMKELEPGQTLDFRILGRNILSFGGPPQSSVASSIRTGCKRKLGLIAGGEG